MSPNRLLRWLLPASLALNAFLGGVVVGRWDHHPHGPPGPPGPAGMAERMAEGLPAADAAILRQAFAARSAVLNQAEETLQASHENIHKALEAPVYDAAALKTVLEGIRAAHESMDEALNAAIIEAAGKMSVDGRRKLGERRAPPPGPPPHYTGERPN